MEIVILIKPGYVCVFYGKKKNSPCHLNKACVLSASLPVVSFIGRKKKGRSGPGAWRVCSRYVWNGWILTLCRFRVTDPGDERVTFIFKGKVAFPLKGIRKVWISGRFWELWELQDRTCSLLLGLEHSPQLKLCWQTCCPVSGIISWTWLRPLHPGSDIPEPTRGQGRYPF